MTGGGETLERGRSPGEGKKEIEAGEQPKPHSPRGGGGGGGGSPFQAIPCFRMQTLAGEREGSFTEGTQGKEL